MEGLSDSSKAVLLISQLLTVLSAVVVAFHPNVLRASVFLLFTFLGVAVLFIFAGADFLAGAQVIIYVGGITILILFAIMLTQWLYQVKLRDVGTKMLAPLLVLILGISPLLFKALSELAKGITLSPPPNFSVFASAPKTHLVGEALLNNYLLPFEAITILLLGALVGAVWIARPK